MPISSSEYARRPLLPRPISTTVTLLSRPFARSGSAPACEVLASPAAVIGRLGNHLDVVGVALHQPGAGDLSELRPLKLADGPGAAKAHGRAQAADELIGDGRQRTAVGHLTLDALRHHPVLAHHVVRQ